MTVLVDQGQWEALAPEHQQKIAAVVEYHFPQAGGVKPRQNVEPVDLNTRISAMQPTTICELACEAASVGGSVACLALGDPAAVSLCIAAVQKGKEWRNNQYQD